MASAAQPAVDGWFTLGAQPRLVGAQCPSCRTVMFPGRAAACPNPACDGTELVSRELSRRARIWSYTTNHYPPPPPAVVADDFKPYTVIAAELIEERLVVLGQATAGVDPADLSIGDEVELAVEPLDGDPTALVWKWRPTG